MTDRLGDGFWLDSEILEFDKELLTVNKYSTSKPVQKTVCAYPMYTAKGNTKVMVLIAAEDPTSTHEALERDWLSTNLSPMPPLGGELQWNCEARLEALYVVLHKHKYDSGSIVTGTSGRLYKWQDWMKNLL